MYVAQNSTASGTAINARRQLSSWQSSDVVVEEAEEQVDVDVIDDDEELD